MVTVTGLRIYPIKSAGGISVEQSEVFSTGLQYDRMWGVIDADSGMFVAQRSDGGKGVAAQRMCNVRTEITDGLLVVRYGDEVPLMVPLDGSAGDCPKQAQVWDDTFTARDQGETAAQWFTRVLSPERAGKYRLVRAFDTPASQRKSKQGEGRVGFADAYPFLVTGEASLLDLVARIPLSEEPLVTMVDFRPNLVLGGIDAYFEDQVTQIVIGGVTFTGQTLCVRCPMTLVEQASGTKRRAEPLLALSKYRKGLETSSPNKVCFGRNFSHVGTGAIRVGEPVTILS